MTNYNAPDKPDNASDNARNNARDLEDQIKANVKDTSNWLRLFTMLVFMVIFYGVFVVTGVVGIIQFLSRLVTGKTINGLSSFINRLSDYSREVTAYITYATDRRPFPFSEEP
jgi:hypothetical protein